jgi:hypothetical protein
MLPNEIILKILLHSDNPYQISQISRSIYTLSQHPMTVAQWLIKRYTPNYAIIGALLYWSSNSKWREFITSKYLKRNSRYRDDFLSRNMFDQASACQHCFESINVRHRRVESMGSILKDLKPALNRASLSIIQCPKEKLQCDVFKLLVLLNCNFKLYGTMLVRFAAAAGHPALMATVLEHLGFELKPYDETTLHDVLRMKPNDHTLTNLLIKVIMDSIDEQNILMLYNCLHTGILQQISQEEWAKVLKNAIFSQNIHMLAILIDAGPSPDIETVFFAYACAKVYSMLCIGFYRKRLKKASISSARFMLYNFEFRNTVQEDLEILVKQVIEVGDLESIQYLRSKNVNLGQRGYLIASVFAGHYNVSKYFIIDCNVDPNIFQDGASLVYFITLLNHFVAIYAIGSLYAAVANTMYCIFSGNGSSGVLGIFGLVDRRGQEWCTKDSSWLVTVIPLIMLTAIYYVLYRSVPLIGFIKGLILCRNRIRMRREVSPA